MARERKPGSDDARASRDDVSVRSGDPYADLGTPTGPIDIAAVRRDDALIEAIAGDGPVATDSADEYQLAALLATWRAEIVGVPLPESPTLNQVVAEFSAVLDDSNLKRRRTRNQLRFLRPVAGAAAIAAFAVGGVAAVSYNAQPGDPLWKVKEVVFTQQADSTVAQVDTTSALQDVEELIAAGDTEAARSKLAEAQSRSESVRDNDEKAQLQEWWNRLSTKLQKAVTPAPVPVAPTTTSTAPSTDLPEDSTSDVPTTAAPPFQLPTDLPLPTDIPWTLPSFQLPSLPFPIPEGFPVPQTSAPAPEILKAPSPAPSSETTAEVPAPESATVTEPGR